MTEKNSVTYVLNKNYWAADQVNLKAVKLVFNDGSDVSRVYDDFINGNTVTMPQGGSITCGAMLPLLFIAYRYGPGIGCLTGFLYGLINILQDPFILHPLQVLFDYPLPYMGNDFSHGTGDIL